MQEKTLGFLILLICSSLGMAFAQQPQGMRRALIIANSSYSDGDSLPTPTADANAMYTALMNAGFNEVHREFNRTHDEIVTDLSTFANGLKPEDRALFYFSGHGFSLGAENFIVPIGFQVGKTQDDTKGAAVSLTSIINRLLAANTQAIILDACRDEPDIIKALPKAISDSSPARNLTAKTSEGTLIAFAAASGKKADATPVEGKSLYTYYLVKTLNEHYGDLQDVMTKTQTAVYDASNHAQKPAVYNEIAGDFPLGDSLPAKVTATSFDSQVLAKALRRNISRTIEHAKLIYTFHRWQIWLALPPELESQVERVTYTYTPDYLKGSNTRYGDLNESMGLTSWLANSCGTGLMQVDVKLKNQPTHVTANFDLCKVPESSDIPPTTE